jgi:hypothetical protein
MNADDLTKAQCAELRSKVSEMVAYLTRLNDLMSHRGFPDQDPIRLAAANALKVLQQLHRELLSRSFDVKSSAEINTPPPVDLLLTRKSALRKDEKYRLGRPRRETH